MDHFLDFLRVAGGERVIDGNGGKNDRREHFPDTILDFMTVLSLNPLLMRFLTNF